MKNISLKEVGSKLSVSVVAPVYNQKLPGLLGQGAFWMANVMGDAEPVVRA